jgi:hypothetical protein
MAFSRVSTTLITNVTGDATVTDVKVASNAAIAYSKLASLATGQVLLGNAGVPTATTISGDASISASGVLTISPLAVVTGDLADNAVTALKVNTGEVAVLGATQQYTRTHNFTATTLTDGATVAWDLSQNQVAVVTLGGNRAMGNPTNIVAGAVYILIVKQDATGGRTLSFPFGTSGAGNTGYRFAGATSSSGAPTLSTAANKIDILTFVATTSTDGTHLYGVSSLNYA